MIDPNVTTSFITQEGMDSDDERAYEPIDERADLTQYVGIEVTWNPIDSNVPETRLMKARSATSRIPVLFD